MAKQTTDNSVRKLTKLGGKSIGLTLPIELVRELGWREKQRVTVKKVRGGFTVRDYRSK
jgi:antitoxin component of MazEF toxin-antitoxin module